MPPKIAIIGAGPAGLTLARLLQRRNITCTVYEAEPGRYSRNQGGSLDLHAKAGQMALRDAGLFDQFQKLSRPEGECIKLLDGSGNVLWDENVTGVLRPANATDRPEIDRTALRDLLLDSLEPNIVQWNRRVDRIHTDPENGDTYTIHFCDGAKMPGVQLLVGADGAFSKVRPLLTDVEPYYSGITAVEQWKLDAQNDNLWLCQYVGAGSSFMFDQDRAVMSQRQSGGAVRVYACLRKPRSWSTECGIDWRNEDVARKSIAEEYFGDCGPDVTRAIRECNDSLIVRHLYMLPVGLRWESKPGATLIGDSAHLATPFAGIGVNLAMKDALDLANAIASQQDGLSSAGLLRSDWSIAAAIEGYEKEMFPRAKEFGQKTLDGLEHHFRESGSREWADRFKQVRYQHPT